MIHKRIIGYGLINSLCDECRDEAVWRIRNLTTGLPIYAACKAHRPIVEQRYHHEYYGEPLPEDHPDAIDAEVTRLELRKEGF